MYWRNFSKTDYLFLFFACLVEFSFFWFQLIFFSFHFLIFFVRNKIDDQSYFTNFCHQNFQQFVCVGPGHFKTHLVTRVDFWILQIEKNDHRLLASLVHRVERNLFRTESFEFIISAKKDRPFIFCFLLGCLFEFHFFWFHVSDQFVFTCFFETFSVFFLVLSAINLMSKVIAQIFATISFQKFVCRATAF